MAILNYRPQDLTFTVGTLEIPGECVEFSISPGLSEPEQLYNWSGSFRVTLTREEAIAGLTEADLTDLEVWGIGQSLVAIALNSDPLPALRIADYQWDAATKTGEGKLTQILDLCNVEQPATPQAIAYSRGMTYKDLIQALLIQGGTLNGVEVFGASEIDLSGAPAILSETRITSPFTSDRPIQDAQEMAGKFWCWLWVDSSEVIRIMQRPEISGTTLIYRSANAVEVAIATERRAFPVAKLICTGTNQYSRLRYEYEDRDESEEEDQQEEEDRQDDEERALYTDEQGRPRRITTTSTKNAYLLFPNRYSPLTTEELVYQIKDVFYFYFDGDPAESDLDFLDWANGLGFTENLENIQEELLIIRGERDRQVSRAAAARRDPIPAVGEEPICTLSLERELRGTVFSGDRPETDLVFSRATLESATKKIQYAPRGQLFQGEYLKYLMVAEDSEEVTAGTTRQLQRRDSETDPATGEPPEVEPEPEREPPQIKSTFEIVTRNLKAETSFQPIGFNAFLPQSNTLDIGLAPSQQALSEYCRKMAHREQQRYRGKVVQMPIPLEWLDAGCPPFPIADIGGDRLILDNPIIEFTAIRSSLVFSGDLVGALVTPIPSLPDPAPQFYRAGLRLATPRSLFGVMGQAIATLQLIPIDGTGPYSYAITSGALPSGVSLNTGTGAITGTPGAIANGSVTITATDAASATASVVVPWVVAGPQSAIIPYSESVEIHWVWEITGRAGRSQIAGRATRRVEFFWDIEMTDGDTTGGGGGY